MVQQIRVEVNFAGRLRQAKIAQISGFRVLEKRRFRKPLVTRGAGCGTAGRIKTFGITDYRMGTKIENVG